LGEENVEHCKKHGDICHKKPKVLAMAKFSNTCFVMMFIILKRLVKVHKSLKQMVNSNAWYEWNNFRTHEIHIYENFVIFHDFWKNA
jgi:hypothetical protein